MMAIEVRKAVGLARQYLQEVLGLQISSTDILLEEVELSEDGKFWLITLSYPGPPPSSIGDLLARNMGNRTYKVVRLRSDTGEFVSVKIRTLVAA
jgi:hypothetical protein